MLAISGLARSTLGSYIDKTNVHLPENAKLYIGLHTGAKNAVVVGPARLLYGLVTALQKICAPAGVDQSKIPYTQCKLCSRCVSLLPSCTLSFLTHYSFFIFTVFAFHQGSDLHKATTSLTRPLCDQMFIHLLHWLKATNFLESATHAIDFGPGGLSGIGPLTARNFEGCRLRTAVVAGRG